MSPLTYQPLAPHKNQNRADFQTEQDGVLRKFFFQYGLAVRWEQAALCPCQRVMSTQSLTPAITKPTGERRSDCPGCGGRGWLYHSPTEIKALVASAARSPQRFAAYGLSLAGAVMITTLPENQPGFYDRFTLLTSTIPYTETRAREGTVETLRYPVASRVFVSADPADATSMTPLTQTASVVYATKTDANGALQVDGSGNPIVLTAGTDFTVTPAGAIDWTPGVALGTAPPVGAWYGLSYSIHPVYTARNHPHVSREAITKSKQNEPSQKALMVQADCWLEWVGA